MPAVRTFIPKPLPRADLDWRALVSSIGRATLALALAELVNLCEGKKVV